MGGNGHDVLRRQDDEEIDGRDQDSSGDEYQVPQDVIQQRKDARRRYNELYDVIHSVPEHERILANSVDVDVPNVHFYQDFSRSHLAVAQNAVAISDGHAMAKDEDIKKGLQFDTVTPMC